MQEPDDANIADVDCASKPPWSAPQMTEVDIVAVTLAGGAALADLDPNLPS